MVNKETAGRSLPVVTRGTSVRDALEILSDARVRWLIVAEPDGIPRAMLSGMDILRSIVPDYLLGGPNLARVVDVDEAKDIVARQMAHPLSEIIDKLEHEHYKIPT